jgi:hypothetical protein
MEHLGLQLGTLNTGRYYLAGVGTQTAALAFGGFVFSTIYFTNLTESI